jgi:hypothetical protein
LAGIHGRIFLHQCGKWGARGRDGSRQFGEPPIISHVMALEPSRDPSRVLRKFLRPLRRDAVTLFTVLYFPI